MPSRPPAPAAPHPSPSLIPIRHAPRVTRRRLQGSQPKVTEEEHHMMKQIGIGLLSLTIVTLFSVEALAWSHGNRWGGSTQHSYGSTSHESAWGTSTSHVAGEGTSHTNVYGG